MRRRDQDGRRASDRDRPGGVGFSLLLATRLIRPYYGEAVLTKSGRAIIGDYGGLQALLFDAYFARSIYRNMSGADLRHYLKQLPKQQDPHSSESQRLRYREQRVRRRVGD